MKRVEERVKDIVEVRPYANLDDFAADSSQTLGGYHFTDITSDLMATWLDRLAAVKSGWGEALALAGFRGVGKSHFLAALGVIAAHPELRSKLDDSHVLSSSHALARKHFPVAYVRRGTKVDLLQELKSSIADLLERPADSLSDSLNELLILASEKSDELPVVLLIDTAFGRDSRVSRDDGVLLSEIAETAKTLGMFVGIALDDDIAGADGVNSSIASSFEIHYLDQEHLYKIVDTHIFPKHNQKQAILHEIYENYRQFIPGFRWSKRRFSSLYPLHPSILEIAPFVRLYLHHFALLGFASEAGARILGRPASSLIALDEVFDNVEKDLRKIADLKDAFEAFDILDHDVVAKTPVMKRLRAKLILKGLLLSSLDGGGATASELSAALLIFDENSPETAVREVEDMLGAFAERLPTSVGNFEIAGRESKYHFRLSGKDGLNTVLTEAIKTVPQDVVPKILRRIMAEKFLDADLVEDEDSSHTDCSIVWRGSIRRGKVVWPGAEADVNRQHHGAGGAPVDWLCVVNPDTVSLAAPDGLSPGPIIEWKLGSLRDDEIDAVLRFHVLHTDTELRETFAEHLVSAVHSHSIAIDKIWRRIYLQDSVLVIDGFEYNLTDEARSAHNLSQLFSIMLEPMFESRFPSHPSFTRVLGMKEVSRLIGDLFGGASPNSAEVQQLAEAFAFPMDLVADHGGHYAPVPVEALVSLPLVSDAFDAAELNSEDFVSLADIHSRLQKAPYGLTREAQHLIMAAFVAGRRFEFVTSNGNRINHRSLDLQIIWDDIVGIAKPSGEVYSTDRLKTWACRITGNSELKSFDTADGRTSVLDALAAWLAKWNETGVLRQFDDLSDENLNTRIWRIAANVKKTFEVAAASVSSAIENTMPLDNCLQSIADAFYDSDEEFQKKKSDLLMLENFIGGAALRDEINNYLAVAEITSDPEIETVREQLVQLIDESYFDSRPATNREMEDIWPRFRTLYSDFYVAKHDAVMNSAEIHERFDQIKRTDLWFEFENLSDMRGFDIRHREEAIAILRELRRLDCGAEISELLGRQPFCSCSFTLLRSEYWAGLPDRFWRIVNEGSRSYRQFLKLESGGVIGALNDMGSNLDDETASAVENLISTVNDSREFGPFSIRELQVLNAAIAKMLKSDNGLRERIEASHTYLSDAIPAEFIEWETEFSGEAA